MTQVGYIVGSLSRSSINRRLAQRLVELAPDALDLTEIEVADLPLYCRDLDDPLPGAVRRFKSAIEGCDGLLVVTPEYNRSIPSALKNAIDWGSRPWGQSSWSGRRAGIIGTALNGAGSAVAQAHLRAVLGYLDVDVTAAPETCLPWSEGVLEQQDTTARLTRFLDVLAERLAARAGVPSRS